MANLRDIKKSILSMTYDQQIALHIDVRNSRRVLKKQFGKVKKVVKDTLSSVVKKMSDEEKDLLIEHLKARRKG